MNCTSAGKTMSAAFIAALLLSSFTADAAQEKPLKIFILSGQSNMQGHANVSTFDVIGMDPATAPMLKEMRNSDGTPRVCDKVWISSIGCSEDEKIGRLTAGFGAEKNGPKIGPEFTFGVYMEKLLKEPILIIKTAWGGKSINTDFRPPGAGPYQFNESQIENMRKQGKDIEKIRAEKADATGHYYRLMMDHVKKVLGDIERIYPDYDENAGYELAGFVWFQGWNDMVDGSSYPNRDKPGGYDAYAEVLAKFIRDVRKDLSTPNLPFVIGVMGVGGPTDKYGQDQMRYKGIHQNFRDAMAAPASMPEFKGSVAAVLTENFWDMEVTALRDKEKTIKPQLEEIRKKVKAQELSREEGKAAEDKHYQQTFSERELTLLKKSTSNFDFHYMGSGKIIGQIGKAFAEAMVEMLKK
jgi:hypothetical protein